MYADRRPDVQAAVARVQAEGLHWQKQDPRGPAGDRAYQQGSGAGAEEPLTPFGKEVWLAAGDETEAYAHGAGNTAGPGVGIGWVTLVQRSAGTEGEIMRDILNGDVPKPAPPPGAEDMARWFRIGEKDWAQIVAGWKAEARKRADELWAQALSLARGDWAEAERDYVAAQAERDLALERKVYLEAAMAAKESLDFFPGAWARWAYRAGLRSRETWALSSGRLKVKRETLTTAERAWDVAGRMGEAQWQMTIDNARPSVRVTPVGSRWKFWQTLKISAAWGRAPIEQLEVRIWEPGTSHVRKWAREKGGMVGR